MNAMDQVEVLQRTHEFEEEDDGRMIFVCSVVVFEKSGSIFVARVPREIPLEGPINVDSTSGFQVNTNLFPPFDNSKFHAATDLEADKSYRKLPSLVYLSLEENEGISCEGMEAELLLREAEILETLHKQPQENIVHSYGCKVQDSRIVGLCLERLDETLARRLRRLGRKFDVEKCMQGVRNALRHVHSLGLCHNDVNPLNVMFRKDGCPVLIDFDSCQPEGEKLTLKGGTEGWCDAGRTLSVRRNDLTALEQLEAYLLTNVAKE